MKTTCIDCGNDYNYDPNNPLGSSRDRCSTCRKKDSARNKKIILLEIAGAGSPVCRMCGYSDISGLTLLNAIEPLTKPTTQKELEAQAKRQFIVCLNCKAKVDAGEVSYRVVDSKPPMDIQFYSRHVHIRHVPIEAAVKFSHDVIETEITTREPENVRAGRTPGVPRIESTIDVQAEPV